MHTVQVGVSTYNFPMHKNSAEKGGELTNTSCI